MPSETLSDLGDEVMIVTKQMGRNVRHRAIALAAVLAGMISAGPLARAATKTWDLDAAGHNNGVINDGAGTWNTTTANWTTNGGTTNTTWSNSGSGVDDAIFGGGVDPAGTITLSANQTPLSITFNNVPSGNFNLTGNTINFSAATTSITQASSSAATIASAVHGADTTLTLGGIGGGILTISGLIDEQNSSHPLAINKTGSSNFTLTNPSSSYTGVTNVTGGTLTVNGTLSGNAAFNVNTTGKLAGTGTVAKTVTINNGGTLSPGGDSTNSNVGAIATNAHTWGTSANYVWEIKNTANSPGVNYDTLNVTGALTISSTAGSPMTIKVVSHGAVTGWNPATTWNWTIASASSITGFVANKFLIDVSDFIDDNPTADPGSFTVNQSGNTIRVSYVPEPGGLTILSLAGVAVLRRHRRGR